MSFLVEAYTFQDFAQTQQIFAQLQNRMTVKFRSSVLTKRKSDSVKSRLHWSNPNVRF